ncbi:LysR family transcriptional regulator [Pelagibius litoralis]|uniref:LysR family transcriptional regulator n=1 Tax=Pelagibius litoralis TaxID=374515 RepID=A0A967KCZ7_9PROT|nr:LysR family transcriptional regulator [Pelagibius litoralis]NIA71144.1 LysR family transcriptional regulator [Pelagibius litoralis]
MSLTNWDDYRYFLAVAESGSLSAAARVLGVAQPTVGRRIAQLEERIQARLFDRLNQGYQLTATGRRAVEAAERMQSDAFNIERLVEGADTALAGRVSIATAEGLGTFWLSPLIPALRRAYPALEVEVLVGVSAHDLLRREADIALRVGNPRSDALVGRRIGQIHCGLFASVDYLAARGEPKTPGDLAGHDIIESVREIAELRQARRLRSLSRDTEVAFRCNSILVQLAAVRAGAGILALPLYMARGDSELVRLLTDSFNVSIDLWLLSHRDLRRTARVRAVLDFIIARAGEDPDMKMGRR